MDYDWPRLHAALNDLPAALLVTAAIFDLISLASRRPVFRQVAFWTLLAGVIGAGAAVLSGLQAEEHIAHGDAVHRVMETHEQLALFSLGLFGAIALWRIVREKRMGGMEYGLLVAISVAGVVLVYATAVQGGRLVFDHAAGISDQVLQNELQQRGQGHQHAEGEGHAEAPGTSPDSVAPSSTSGHVDPPGTPPHTHADPPGSPPHEH
jgi:uncharacterized membrane protein